MIGRPKQLPEIVETALRPLWWATGAEFCCFVIVIVVECCSNKTALLSLPTTGRGVSLVQIDSNAPPPASSQPVSKTEIGNAQELLLSDFQSVCRRRNTGN